MDPTLKLLTKKQIAEKVKEMTEIFNEIKDIYQNEDFLKLEEKDKIDELQTKYIIQYRQYPLVMRCMISLQLWSSRAFERFLYKSAVQKTAIDAKILNADYVKWLYMEKYPHMSSKNIQKIWQNTFNNLKKEEDLFKKVKEKLIAREKEEKLIIDIKKENLSTLKNQSEKLIDLKVI